MQIEKVKISQVKNNPNNPRVIKNDDFRKLVKSIKEAPWMLQLRSIIVMTITLYSEATKD